MITCLIVAFKVEEYNINPSNLISEVEGADPAKIMEYEPYLLEGIKFQVHIYSPFDALEGLKMLLSLPEDFTKSSVESEITRSYLSDALFLYTPGVIAAAAIYLKDKELIKGLTLTPEQLEKVREASEVIKNAKETTQTEYNAIATKIKQFEKLCPEFMKYMDEAMKKKSRSVENKRKVSEGDGLLQVDPTTPKRPKFDDRFKLPESK